MTKNTKKTKIVLSWLLIFSLAFSFNFGVFAEEAVVSQTSEAETATEVPEESLGFSAEFEDISTFSASVGMEIISAEVLYEPGTEGAFTSSQLRRGLTEEQARYMLANYRKTMVQDPAHENANQYRVGQGDMYQVASDTDTIYTYLRNPSLSEGRIFNVQATIPKGSYTTTTSGAGLTATNFDPQGIELWYGVGDNKVAGRLNRPLGDVTDAWTGAAPPAGFNFGTGAISEIEDVDANIVGDNIVIDIRIKFFNMQNDGSGASTTANRLALHNDLRRGNAKLRLHYGSEATSRASMPFDIRYRDYQVLWEELDDYLRDNKNTVSEFIEADGTTTAGNGSFSFGDRFVRVQSLGKTMGVTTNTPPFAPLPGGPNDIWVAMVSDSKISADRYINEIVPMMNTNPMAVRSTFDDNVRLPVVYTNIHSGEQAGLDAVFHLYNLIAQEKSIKYERANEVKHQGPNLDPFSAHDGLVQSNFIFGSQSNLGSRWSGGMFADHFTVTGSNGYATAGQTWGTGANQYTATQDLFRDEAHYMSFWNIMDPGKGSTLTTLDVDELLEDYIFIFFFTQNPDGRILGGQRPMTYNMDPNRDGLFHTMPESVIGKTFLAEWEPVYLLEYHNTGFPYMVDPCTAPHDPNLEYDLIGPRAHAIGREITAALTGTGAQPRVLINDENIDWGNDFDDASPVYSPGFSNHFGGIGATIEADGVGARHVLSNMAAGFGTMYDLHHRADDYLGFKIEYKRRGVENENTDAKVNPFLYAESPNANIHWEIPGKSWGSFEGKPPWTWADKGDSWSSDGRRVDFRDALDSTMIPRPTPTEGGRFFPHYYIIPMNSEDQLDISQAQHMLEYLTRVQVRVERLTQDTTVDGKLYKPGSLVVDMRQGNRDIANTVLNVGALELSPSPVSLYAECVHSFGILRGFTVDRIDVENVFNDRTAALNYDTVNAIKRVKDWKALLTWHELNSKLEGSGDTIVVKNNSLSALRAVFKALKEDQPVRMLTSEMPGLGVRGDFVMSRTVFNRYQNEFYMEGTAVASLDNHYSKALVRPVIQINGTEGENRHSFEGLGLVRGTDFNYGSTVNRNVVINHNDNTATNFDPVLEGGTGIIYVGTGNGHALAGSAMGSGYTFIPSLGSSVEAILRAEYNTNSTITANMELADHMFTQWGSNIPAITALPDGAIPLVTSLNDNHIPEAERYRSVADRRSFFRAGWPGVPQAENTPVDQRRKALFADKTFVAAGTYQGRPNGAPIVIFTTNIFHRGHNHLYAQRMLGNAILSISAGINPDNSAVVDSDELRINWVQLANTAGGEVQVLYRDRVYKGDAGSNGEDPNLFYTECREFDLKDPRVFNVEFIVPSSALGITTPTAFLESVNFTYGGHPLSSWRNGNTLRGTATDAYDILTMSNKKIEPVTGGFRITADIGVLSPWAASNPTATSVNIPYANFVAGGQGHFGGGQTADNRAWWQAGPTRQGIGREYTLSAGTGTGGSRVELASTDIRIGAYRGMYSWIGMNEFCQNLIEAIEGSKLSISYLDTRPIGMMAAGYVAMKDGKFVAGDSATDVYVEVHILGYGHTDNSRPENAGFNNYSRFNAQWNIVVAKSEKTVDDYLKPGGTLDTMNNNPQVLIDKYKDMPADEIDLVTVYYQNNTHADEVTGTENMIHLIKYLIEGGKAGKTINYNTVGYGDVDWRYFGGNANNPAFNAPGIPTGSTHVLADGLAGTNRIAQTFDTAEALDHFIFVSTLCSNPDGKAGMRRVNRYAMDMNRDGIFSTQPETISLTKDIAKWNPIFFNEWHGYVGTMLIEPCTAPHAPTFEYDLLQNNMLKLAYEGGKAIMGSTGYNAIDIPWDHRGFGAWDDGGTIYAPMFSMLFGTMGYTIELPHSNTDSLEAGEFMHFAMLNTLMKGETAFYPGNRLNGQLPDLNGVLRDSHEVDNKYKGPMSMRKSSIMNLLEQKRRGVVNYDSMAADKYFIDSRDRNNWDGVVVVGRDRVDDGQGGKLPYFPDYIIIPTADDQQYNVAEGIKALNHIMERKAKVSVSNRAVTYQGVTYPAGTYVIDMKQGNRNFVFEVMGKGYDATFYSNMYADIYANFPDVRGFDSVQAWNRLNGGTDVFAGALTPASSAIQKRADISGTPADYVIFKSQSTDAVRFVNLLLSGRSSGPSTAAKGDVWMLRDNLPGVANGDVGTKADYVIRRSDLDKINSLVDNPDLGLIGCHIVGEYIGYLPAEAVKLVEPIISYSVTRGAQTGGPLWWAWDDYLGFNMRNPDGTDYNGGATLRPGANVVIQNGNFSGSTTSTNNGSIAASQAIANENATAFANAIRSSANKPALILINPAQDSSSQSTNNQGVTTFSASVNALTPFGGNLVTAALNDVALYGNYNVNDSLFTANYEITDSLYARGTGFTASSLPGNAKTLFRSLPNGEDAFIGGFQNTFGSKEPFADRVLAFSTILSEGIEGKPIQAVVVGQNMNNRSHYQKLYPMIATAIFAGAAGILDDQDAPVISGISARSVTATQLEITVNATDIHSGIASYEFDVYGSGFNVEVNNNVLTIRGASVGTTYEFEVKVTDWAGNYAVREYSHTMVRPPSGGGRLPMPGRTGGVAATGATEGTTEETIGAADVTLSDGSGKMDAVATSKAVEEALEDEDATVVVITLPEGVGSATFSIDDIKLIQERELDLVVEKDGVRVVIPHVNLMAYVPENAEEVVISITPVDDAKISGFMDRLGDKEDSLLLLFDVEFIVDGVSVTSFMHKPLQISIPNSKLGLEPGDDASSFRLNANLTLTYFGGALNVGSFVFYTDRLSTYGIMKDVKVNRLNFSVGQQGYSVNGANRTSDVAPFIDDNARTLVPLRAIAEALGAAVAWDEATFTATLELDGRTLSIVPEVIVSSRTMVPMRYVSESLGANVVWDGSTRGIAIYRE